MRKTNKVVQTILLSLLCVVAVPLPTFAVVNPDPVLSRKIPASVVALHWKADRAIGEPTQFCTGTVIAPTWVLTAAHCMFETEDGYGVYVSEYGYEVYVSALAGTNRLYADVVRAVVPPNSRHDVALLKLAEPLPGVEPMRLVGKSDEAAVRDPSGLVLYGWGLVDRGPEPDFSTKEEWLSYYANKRPVLPSRPKAVRQYNDENPEIRMRPKLHVATKYVDSRGYMQGSCNGDSGGPLVSYRSGVARLVAVVSYGLPECLEKVAGVNARIAPVRDWITATIASGTSSPR